MIPHRGLVPVLTACVLLCLVGCKAEDPREEILTQRARWNVQLLDWVQTPEGTLNVGTRITGPASSKIERLTVMFDLQDASGGSLGRRWHTYDLSQAPRGGPADLTIRLEAEGLSVEALGLDLMLQPEAEEERHIEELRGLPARG